MTDTVQDIRPLGLFGRMVGVLTSPTETFRNIVASPRPAGVLLIVALVVGISAALPQFTGLANIFPNPLHLETTISFTLAQPERVRLAVYDLRGALVRTIIDEGRAAGRYNVRWDGRDASGVSMAPGVYFLKSKIGQTQTVSRLLKVAE